MEKKLLKKQILKNLFIIFLTFLALLSFFDIIIYEVMSKSLLDSVDEELRLGKSSYEWQLNATSIIEENTVATNSQINSMNYQVLYMKNEIKQEHNIEKMSPNDKAIVENPKIEQDIKPDNDINNKEKQNQSNNSKTVKEKKEKQKTIIKESGIDQDNTKAIKEYIDKLNTINPRLITIERDSNGTITNEEDIGKLYDNYQNQLVFNKNNLENIYNLIINDFTYRGLNFSIEESGNIRYVQLLINIDSEKNSINNILESLTLGSSVILIVSLIASYFLSKRNLKPIIDSYHKETEFVQNASHELRTPLTIIQTKQELLLQEPNSKIIDKSEDISICLQETRRLTKLINELMILAKSDVNKYKLNKEITDVDELVKSIITPYIELYNKKREIVLELNYKKKYNLDKDKISELIIILLDNAIKYTKEKDRILIKTYENNKKVVFEIQDTGIGIQDKSIKKIFDRFYREDKSHSKKIRGNGLGLSIAKTIVHSHNGTIKVSHNKPKGTIFTIKI